VKPRKGQGVFESAKGRIILRPVSWKDLRRLTRFANALVAERGVNPNLGIVSLDRRVSIEDERRFMKKVIRGVRDDEFVSVAAFDGEKMVGNCDIIRRKPHDVRHSGVLGIVILKEFRGIGLGRTMMNMALRRALDIGIWLVELQVFSNNRAARTLYRQLGFKEIGILPNKILRRGRHIDEVQMYIDLRGIDKSTELARVLG
jgi:RimJ/RimL family protein N-acetyltransferase